MKLMPGMLVLSEEGDLGIIEGYDVIDTERALERYNKYSISWLFNLTAKSHVNGIAEFGLFNKHYYYTYLIEEWLNNYEKARAEGTLINKVENMLKKVK
jgi:hypothetical protein